MSASSENRAPNLHAETVTGFGAEWAAFDQQGMPPEETRRQFDIYFGIFPWASLPGNAEGFDLGCGSGRWALLAAPRVGRLHCIDASAEALGVARKRLTQAPNVTFHHASVDAIPLGDATQDFGYCLGVLHHVPDTAAGLADCVAKLKPGAPFLVYLYYRFDNRPAWFRAVWQGSDLVRRVVSRLPFAVRRPIADVLALGVYWPLSRAALLAERWGRDVAHWPLASYRTRALYSLRTDSLDRFATQLEHRFTRAEIVAMMEAAGLEGIRFNERESFWTAVGTKRRK
jgi:ubiquinone/menaquinone biosynthesis C-methylase UbiE